MALITLLIVLAWTYHNNSNTVAGNADSAMTSGRGLSRCAVDCSAKESCSFFAVTSTYQDISNQRESCVLINEYRDSNHDKMSVMYRLKLRSNDEMTGITCSSFAKITDTEKKDILAKETHDTKPAHTARKGSANKEDEATGAT